MQIHLKNWIYSLLTLLVTAGLVQANLEGSGAGISPGIVDEVPPNPATLSSVIQRGLLTTGPSPSLVLNQGYFAYQSANEAYSALIKSQQTTCQGCTVIRYIAFREHNTRNYLTPNGLFLGLVNGPPGPNQLMTAQQNVDGTWSFKTKDNLYVSHNTAYSYITMAAGIGMGERFYLERKGDWMYVESAFNYRYFWTISHGTVLYELNKASRLVMEVWPDL